MRNVAKVVTGGLGALCLYAAMITGMSADRWSFSNDPAERSSVAKHNSLAAQHAWAEFWVGGLLVIAAGVIAVWPTKQLAKRP